MNKFRFKLCLFTTSRFYRWSKIIVWAAAILSTPAFRGDITVLYCYAAAAAYSIIPPLIERILDNFFAFRRNHPTQNEIEEHKITSPFVIFLNTMFDDISHINEIHDGGSVRLSFSKMKFSEFPDFYLYLAPISERDYDSVRFLHDAAVAWHRGEGEKSPEELQKDFASCFRYAKDGYTAKNASLCRFLEEDSLRRTSFDSDLSIWFLEPAFGMMTECAGHKATKLDIIAITECAEAHGYRVRCYFNREEKEYTMLIYFKY